MKYLLYLFKRVPVRLRIVYIVSLLLSNCPLVFDIITPVFFGSFLDSLIIKNINYYSLLYLFASITLSTILPVIGLYLYEHTELSISIEYRVNLFDSFMRLPQSEIKRKSDVYYARVINEDVAALMNMFRPDLYVAVFQIIRSIVIFVVIFKTSVYLAVPFVILFVFSFILSYKAQNSTYEDNKEIDNKLGEILTFISESLSNNTIIHFFNFDGIRRKIYEKFSVEIADSYYKVFKKHSKYLNIWGNTISFVLHIVIYIISIYLVIYDEISIGMFSVITSYFSLVTMQYGTLSSFSNTFSMVKANVIRITEMFSKIKNKKSLLIEDSVPLLLSVSDYQLEHSSKTIDKLELTDNVIYGIIGLTGTGKTSLLNAILGEKSESGSISINGYNSDEFDFNQIITIHDQKSSILNDTVMTNIIMGYPYDETLYNKIISDLEMNELALRKENLGIDGCNLSGGEKQKIAFARFLYSLNFKRIAILDEPFANMDLLSKKKCLQTLDEYINHKHLVLFISHNISDLLKTAGEFIVFEDNGQILKYSKDTIKKSAVVMKLLEINREEYEE